MKPKGWILEAQNLDFRFLRGRFKTYWLEKLEIVALQFRPRFRFLDPGDLMIGPGISRP